MVFNTSTSSWQTVTGGLDSQLMGADGSNLVFLGQAEAGVQLVWVPLSQIH